MKEVLLPTSYMKYRKQKIGITRREWNEYISRMDEAQLEHQVRERRLTEKSPGRTKKKC